MQGIPGKYVPRSLPGTGNQIAVIKPSFPWNALFLKSCSKMGSQEIRKTTDLNEGAGSLTSGPKTGPNAEASLSLPLGKCEGPGPSPSLLA